MQRAGLLAATLLSFALSSGLPARAEDCPTLLHLHGYLTVAIVKCGFKEAAEIINAASACRTQVGHAAATRTATDGIRFAKGEMTVKGGAPAWCTFVKTQYPTLVSGTKRR